MANRNESPTRHHDEKLRQILKSSAKIFAEKGFHSTSIRDIARATRMSLAGLYYYFSTKEELLFLIQEQCFLTLLQRWEKNAELHNDARVRIRVFVENHLGFFLHNMFEMKVMAREDESLTGEFQEKILLLKRRYVKVLMDLIEEMQSLVVTAPELAAGTYNDANNPLTATGATGGIYTRTWQVTNNTPIAGIKTLEVTVTWRNYNEPHTIRVVGTKS